MTGREQAEHDGIEYYYAGVYRNRIKYRIPCEMCGDIIERFQYSSSKNYVCDYCKGLVKKKTKLYIAPELLETRTKKEIQFDKAVEEIRRQVEDFGEYKKPIEIAKTRAERYGSIPEAMVAIELLHLKYKIVPQQKVGKYKVDFAIPDKKMVVEVDGEVFHRYDRKRDREAQIQLMLGLDWKIVRIPAEFIRINIKKLSAAINTQFL